MGAKFDTDKLEVPSFTLGHGLMTLAVIVLLAFVFVYILLPLLSIAFSLLLWTLIALAAVVVLWMIAPTLVINGIGGLLSFIDNIRR